MPDSRLRLIACINERLGTGGYYYRVKTPDSCQQVDMKTVKVLVSGRVQGVGFRYFVKRHARELQLNGHARNLPDGRVEVVAQGSSSSVQALLELLKKGPDYASVTSLASIDLVDTTEYKDFLTG